MMRYMNGRRASQLISVHVDGSIRIRAMSRQHSTSSTEKINQRCTMWDDRMSSKKWSILSQFGSPFKNRIQHAQDGRGRRMTVEKRRAVPRKSGNVPTEQNSIIVKLAEFWAVNLSDISLILLPRPVLMLSATFEPWASILTTVLHTLLYIGFVANISATLHVDISIKRGPHGRFPPNSETSELSAKIKRGERKGTPLRHGDFF